MRSRFARNPWSLLALLCAVALLVSACGQGSGKTRQESQNGPQTPTTEPVTVEWWGQPRGDFDPIIDELFVNSFNDSHTDIVLNYVRRENHEDTIRVALQARNAPDIIQTNGPTEVVSLAKAGLLVPLDEYAEKYGWKEKMLPWAYEAGLVDGHLYSVPLTFETMLLYYNKTLFEQYDLPLPKTRADIEAACQKAEEVGLICFANGTGGRASRGEWWIGWHMNAGAGPEKVYQALKGEIPFTSPEFAQAIDLNKEWILKGWYNGTFDRYFTLDHDENWALLGSGRALMRVSGNWDLQRMLNFCDADCDWLPAPVLNPNVPEHYELAVGESLSISADSQNPDAAAEVLNHLFNDQQRAAQLIEQLEFSTWMVPLEFDASDFSSDADPRLARFIADFSEMTAEGRVGYTTWTFFPPKTRTTVFEGFEVLLHGDITTEEYLKTVQQTFETEKGDVPPLPAPAMK